MQSKNPYRDGRALQRCGALFTWRAHLTHCLRCPCCPAAEIAAEIAAETAAEVAVGNRKEMFLDIPVKSGYAYLKHRYSDEE